MAGGARSGISLLWSMNYSLAGVATRLQGMATFISSASSCIPNTCARPRGIFPFEVYSRNACCSRPPGRCALDRVSGHRNQRLFISDCGQQSYLQAAGHATRHTWVRVPASAISRGLDLLALTCPCLVVAASSRLHVPCGPSVPLAPLAAANVQRRSQSKKIPERRPGSSQNWQLAW